MDTLVTGATGLVGRALLAKVGPSVVLTRHPDRAKAELRDHRLEAWDGRSVFRPEILRGVRRVVHLAGEPLRGRWTPDKKRQIEESRVLGTRRLVDSLEKAPPEVLVCASAIGFYGDRGDARLTENSPAGQGFLSSVCLEWEQEAMRAAAFGTRVVLARLGIVLAREGGALKEMLPAFRLGVAGKLGSGEQWMSWIHLGDVVGLLEHALSHGETKGALNVVAPEPVTNAAFTRELGHALHRPTVLSAPKILLRAALGEMADVVLASHRVVPEKALAEGYRFRFPTLQAALADLFAPSSTSEAHA